MGESTGAKIKTVTAAIMCGLAIAGTSFGMGTILIGGPSIRDAILRNHEEVLEYRKDTIILTKDVHTLEIAQAVIIERLRSIESKLDATLKLVPSSQVRPAES